MKNRVYGVLGVKSIMSNWNADFTGYPKTITSGEIFGSDKALKYAIRKYWSDKNERIMYMKSFIEKGKKLVPRQLAERYLQLFEKAADKDTSYDEVLKNLFSCLDIKNFGAAFAVSNSNYSITGAVQIGQGFNKYKIAEAQVQEILSPFATKEDNGKAKDQSTIGNKIVVDEAHYVYPFAINPKSYDDYIELGVTEGYTEEDYKKFKEAALIAATYLNTNSKFGSDNELAVFIECSDELYLPELAQYVEFEKGEEGEKDKLILGFDKLLKSFRDKIEKIEIYYNDLTTEIIGEFDKVKYYNIFTREEVK